MNQLCQRLLMSLAIAFAAGAARADLIEVQWDRDGRFVKEVQLPAGKFVEVCEKLRAGDKVRWEFSGSAPTNFNVHYHEGKDVRFPARQDHIARSSGLLEATVDHDYCWMWLNKGAGAVQLHLALTKGA